MESERENKHGKSWYIMVLLLYNWEVINMWWYIYRETKKVTDRRNTKSCVLWCLSNCIHTHSIPSNQKWNNKTKLINKEYHGKKNQRKKQTMQTLKILVSFQCFSKHLQQSLLKINTILIFIIYHTPIYFFHSQQITIYF